MVLRVVCNYTFDIQGELFQLIWLVLEVVPPSHFSVPLGTIFSEENVVDNYNYSTLTKIELSIKNSKKK